MKYYVKGFEGLNSLYFLPNLGHDAKTAYYAARNFVHKNGIRYVITLVDDYGKESTYDVKITQTLSFEAIRKKPIRKKPIRKKQ